MATRAEGRICSMRCWARVVEGRKREGAVAMALDKLSIGIKQDHRAKL